MIPISIVIPTHDRRAPLQRTLAALARQDYPPDAFEVVVAVDGSTDDTREMLRAARLPFALRTVAFDASRGAAAARNLGARAAAGRLLLFLDDDIEAAPGLLAAHACAHQRGASVSTGYLRTTSPHHVDFFQVTLRSWWEAMFAKMRRPGHRYSFRDVLTGNCAIDMELFRAAGGFDETFRCHEDYEIGVRLVDASAEICFVQEAAAVHHECTTVSRAFARKRDEGRADVRMLSKHPHLCSVLPLGVFERYATRAELRLRRLVFQQPAAARLFAAFLAKSMRAFESARLRGRWLHRLNHLLHYWYWRGVADVVPDFRQFHRLRAECRSRSEWRPDWLDIDLSAGLDTAMALIDTRRPDGVSIRYGEEHLGDLPALPGAQRLKGIHLKASLALEFAGPLVAALRRAGAIHGEGRWNRISGGATLPVAALRL